MTITTLRTARPFYAGEAERPLNSEKEATALLYAEITAREALAKAFVDFLVAVGRSSRHFAADSSFEFEDETALAVSALSDNDLDELATRYVERNLTALTLVGRSQYTDLLFDRDSAKLSAGFGSPQIGHRGPAISRDVRSHRSDPFKEVRTLPWQSAIAQEVAGLSPTAQHLYEANFEATMRSAHSWARRAGISEAGMSEVEESAERTLSRAAEAFNPEHASGASFHTYLLARLQPDVAKAIRRIKIHTGGEAQENEIPDTGENIEAELGSRHIEDEIRRLVKTLPTRERQVVEGHNGLGGQRRRTLRELAKDLGIHDVTARQIYARALRRLREALAGQGMEEYLGSWLGQPLR